MTDPTKTFRDHFLSIYQSAARDFAQQSGAGEVTEGPAETDEFLEAVDEVASVRAADRSEAMSVETEEGLADIPKICASLGARYLEALIGGDRARAARIKEQMQGGTCDPRWASTLTEYAKYFGVFGTRREIPYVRPATVGPRTIPMKPGARIAVFGDWGTGAAPARRILNMIRSKSPDVLVHLGDIYYSGTPAECDANFTTVIRSVFGPESPDIPVFTLAGNHDMYSGGLGYYGLVAGTNPMPHRQEASFFCLRTEDRSWQLLAMDTGLHDYSPLSVTDALTYVEEDEQVWLEDRVREFPGKTILLSHHQLFSAFSQIGKPTSDGKLVAYNPNLLSVLRRLQAAGDVPAWLWGHEHNLCIYRPHLGLSHGRCIGHGAIPIFVEEKPYQVLPTLADPPELVADTQLSSRDGAYSHGFALLTLGIDGNSTKAEYFDENGLIHSEQF